jgi:DNA adenine methylase
VPKSTAIKIAGGKVYQAARIVSLIPPHETFLEPYFGGGSVLLNKPCEGINEIVCDIDGHLMNFWNVLRDKKQFAEFRRMCQATPFSEQLWKDQDDEALGKGTAVDRAWAFFVRCRQSRSGDRESFATVSTGRRRRGMNEQVSAWLSAIDGLEEIHARLQRVLMLTEDGVRLLKKYDGKKVFAYCLPPGELVRTEDEQLVPIETVEKGQRLAGGRTVNTTMSRDYAGSLLTLKIQGLPRSLRVTADHRIVRIPGRVKGRQDKRTSAALWSAKETVAAKDCRPGDYVLVPLGGASKPARLRLVRRGRSNVGMPRKPVTFLRGNELYRLIGYYAAEGHTGGQVAATTRGARRRRYSTYLSFGVHERETWVADAEECIQRVFGLVSRHHNNGAGVLQLQLHSATVARALARWVPGTANSKRLAQKIMTAPPRLQREILVGWLRGDGGLEDNGRGRVRLLGTTASFALAEQMFRIALRCGLRPTYKLRGGRIHDIYFAAEDAEWLGWPVSSRRFCSTRRIVQGHMLCRIREIEVAAYAGRVYDLDVDQDDLFAAPYALVHNCDPPYPSDTRTKNLYQFEMSDAQHTELLLTLGRFRGKFLLSTYPNPLYEAAAKKYKWTFRDLVIDNKLSGKREKEKKIERVYANFAIPAT